MILSCRDLFIILPRTILIVKTQKQTVAYFVICLLMLLVLACGKKTAPRPPEALAPAPVKLLSAKASVDALILKWDAPSANASGDRLIDLKGFIVKRADADTGDDLDFDVIAELGLDKSDAKRADTSKSYLYRDSKVEPGKKYQYLVVGVNEDDVEGAASTSIKVTFIGESSIIENFAGGIL